MRAADTLGIATCYTCGKREHWKKGDAGHFMSRGAMSTRWNERNVQYQCKRCNIFRHGEQYKFSVALCREYGANAAQELLQLSKQTAKYSIHEMRDMIRLYKNEVEAIKRSKGIE